MANNFSEVMKDINPYIQNSYWIPSWEKKRQWEKNPYLSKKFLKINSKKGRLPPKVQQLN